MRPGGPRLCDFQFGFPLLPHLSLNGNNDILSLPLMGDATAAGPPASPPARLTLTWGLRRLWPFRLSHQNVNNLSTISSNGPSDCAIIIDQHQTWSICCCQSASTISLTTTHLLPRYPPTLIMCQILTLTLTLTSHTRTRSHTSSTSSSHPQPGQASSSQSHPHSAAATMTTTTPRVPASVILSSSYS